MTSRLITHVNDRDAIRKISILNTPLGVFLQFTLLQFTAASTISVYVNVLLCMSKTSVHVGNTQTNFKYYNHYFKDSYAVKSRVKPN